VGAGVAVVGGIVSYASGRGYLRWIGTALGLLIVSGLTRLLEYWIAQAPAVFPRVQSRWWGEWLGGFSMAAEKHAHVRSRLNAKAQIRREEIDCSCR
jgi:hypothetical protein